MKSDARSLCMYVSQQLAPPLPGDASRRNIVGPLKVQLTILDTVFRSLASHALGIFLLLWQGPLKQVHLQLLSPAPLLRLEREEQPSS